MNLNLFYTLFTVLMSSLLFGQDPMSRADIFFYEYAYQDAIQEYRKEMVKKPLSNKQFLNLADSYFKTGNYQGASDTYFEVYKRDSTMSTYHFNNMLQSMTKTSGLDRTKALLATRTSDLTSELMENAEFNFELLAAEVNIKEEIDLINVQANSPQADFSPSFYKDQMLFTSGRGNNSKDIYEPSGESYLDIFVAQLSEDGNINNPNPFNGIPDSKFHQATPYYSKDLESVFFVNSIEENGELLFDDNGKNSLAIGKSDGQEPLLFLLKDLSTSFYYPFYDHKTGKLYFAANFGDGYGGTDIYYVRTNNRIITSSPVNLGARINTPGNEISPYIFQGSLYFASDVFYGLGEMDIYKSEIQGDDEFSIPVNLGTDLNSSSDDFGLIIKDNGERGLIGYFASNRPGGKGGDDIYGFKMAKKPGMKTFAIKGRVININSQDGVSKVRVRLLDSIGTTIKEVYSSDDGNYRIEIPWQQSITVVADKNKYSTYTMKYKESELDAAQSASYEIAIASLDDLVEEKEDHTVIKINDFHFSKSSTQLPTTALPELDKVVDVMNKFPQLQLRIEAHTDSRGGSATNFRLSQGRANNMKKFLIDKGVPESSILYTVGYGEDKILNQCTNGVYCLEILHQKNERYHFVVLNYNLLD